MYILLGLIIIVLLIGVIILLVYSMLTGGPYAPIGMQRSEQLLSVLNIKKNELAADLGSGDGRLVIALAKKGAIAHGYELNPLLVWIARRKIKKEGLEKRAFIHMTDMWQINYKDFDIITIYLSPHIMGRLETKIIKELKKGARVAMNHYHFPNWKYTKKSGSVYLYTK